MIERGVSHILNNTQHGGYGSERQIKAILAMLTIVDILPEKATNEELDMIFSGNFDPNDCYNVATEEKSIPFFLELKLLTTMVESKTYKLDTYDITNFKTKEVPRKNYSYEKEKVHYSDINRPIIDQIEEVARKMQKYYGLEGELIEENIKKFDGYLRQASFSGNPESSSNFSEYHRGFKFVREEDGSISLISTRLSSSLENGSRYSEDNAGLLIFKSAKRIEQEKETAIQEEIKNSEEYKRAEAQKESERIAEQEAKERAALEESQTRAHDQAHQAAILRFQSKSKFYQVVAVLREKTPYNDQFRNQTTDEINNSFI